MINISNVKKKGDKMNNNNNNKSKILKNISSSLIQKFISTIYYFIIPILIIRKFGSEVNGLVSSITQFVAYISLLELGIGPVIKFALFKPLTENNKKEISSILGASVKFFRKLSYIFAIYIIILCFFYPNTIKNFSNWYVVSLILIIAFGRISEYFFGMTYNLFLQADQKNYVANYTISITYILNIILILLLLKFNCSIHMVYLVTALTYAIRPVLLKVYFKKKYNYQINKKTDYKIPQQWDCLVHHIASIVQNNTDVLILTIFNNLINVSIYSVYYMVTSGIRTIIQSFTTGIDALFGKIMAGENDYEIKDKFEQYIFSFYTITTAILSCTLILIIPFITLYTRNITDANYIQPLFAYLMVFAEFSYVSRYPYSNIVFAKGHFKQTSNFSILEPIINIILSMILVIKFGLIGVAIGTFVSMFIRTIGFMVYGSKNILKISVWHSFKYYIISFLEISLIFVIHLLIGNILVDSYFKWILMGLISFVTISAMILIINSLIFKEPSKKVLKKIFKRVKK